MDNDLIEALKDMAFAQQVIQSQQELIEKLEQQIRVLKGINSLSQKNQDN